MSDRRAPRRHPRRRRPRLRRRPHPPRAWPLTYSAGCSSGSAALRHRRVVRWRLARRSIGRPSAAPRRPRPASSGAEPARRHRSPGATVRRASSSSSRQRARRSTSCAPTRSPRSARCSSPASASAGSWPAACCDPIGRITGVARDIQATDLSRRIALQRPDDELQRARRHVRRHARPARRRPSRSQRQFIQEASPRAAQPAGGDPHQPRRRRSPIPTRPAEDLRHTAEVVAAHRPSA